VPGPRLRTDFPGGNGVDFQWRRPDHLRFAADMRGGPCSMWFHFMVEGPACDVLHCELINGKTALGWPYGPYVRPVFRHPGESWRRTPPTVTDNEAGRFEFDVECGGRTTEIAYCYPYQLADWDTFFNAKLRPAGAEVIDLGRTGMGRRYFACRLGRGPMILWLEARAHSGETPGSHVLEGALAQIVEAGDPNISAIVVPFTDLDGVVGGMYGKNRPPLDFNRSWHVEEGRLEIRECKAYAEGLPTPPIVAVDLHAPTPHGSHYLCHSGENLVPERAKSLARLAEALLQESETDATITLDRAMSGAHEDWHPEGEQHMMTGYFKRTHGALAFTLESAYHATHLGVEVGPESWRKLGRLLARVVLSRIRTGA
jgi:hypothetical protein